MKVKTPFCKNKLILLASLIFLLPFIGIAIGDCTGFVLFNVYTFGVEYTDDFYALWVSIFGVFGILYNINQNQKRINQQEKQIESQKEDFLQNRFYKTIELLANPGEAIRIGAIHSLHHLRNEHAKEFRELIIDMLCSHVRTITAQKKYHKRNCVNPSIEVQLIIDILREEQCATINLKGSYLAGVDFMGIHWKEANFEMCNLNDARFNSSTISDSNFIYSDLTDTDFTDANLNFSKMNYTTNYKTIYEEAVLSGTDFSGADFEEVNFSTSFFIENAYFDDDVIFDEDLVVH